MAVKNFRKELRHLINKHSIENGSDTPDFILAEYLKDCLKAFDKATKRRTDWHIDHILPRSGIKNMAVGGAKSLGGRAKRAPIGEVAVCGS
jgi:hypothetical protein